MTVAAGEPEAPTAVVKVARDLTAICDLAPYLDDQAEHRADGRDLPGGPAMVALGPVASPEAWEHQYEAAEAWNADPAHDRQPRRPVEHVADEDESYEPPLQTLLFWSEQWRVVHNRESDRRPTVDSEAGFIRGCLDWAWGHEPHFGDFADDINQARVRMENTLYAGQRNERTRVPCDNDACGAKPQLIRVYGATAVQDRYKCPACKKGFDQSDFEDAYARQLRSEGAERYVRVADGVGTLRALGRSERTVRKWFEECQVQGYCDMRTRQVWAWWPDLWRLHMVTKTRPHVAA